MYKVQVKHPELSQGELWTPLNAFALVLPRFANGTDAFCTKCRQRRTLIPLRSKGQSPKELMGPGKLASLAGLKGAAPLS